MGDSKEIKAGVALLNYVQEITSISMNISKAMTEVYYAKTLLETSYVGDAKEEMTMYIGSLYAHIQKMSTMYGSLMTYIYNAYETLAAKDEALAEWILQNWGIEVEVEDGEIRAKEG